MREGEQMSMFTHVNCGYTNFVYHILRNGQMIAIVYFSVQVPMDEVVQRMRAEYGPDVGVQLWRDRWGNP